MLASLVFVGRSFTIDTSCTEHEFLKSLLKALRKGALSLVHEFDLVGGLMYAQFIRMDDRYWLIATTCHCPEDLYVLYRDVRRLFLWGRLFLGLLLAVS